MAALPKQEKSDVPEGEKLNVVAEEIALNLGVNFNDPLDKATLYYAMIY